MNVDKLSLIMAMDERDLYGEFTKLLPLRKQRKLLKMLYDWGNSRYFEAIASKIESGAEAKVQCCIDMHNGYVVRNVNAYIEALCAYIRGHATLTEVMREYRYELNDGTRYGEPIPAKLANNREQLMLIDLCGRLPYGVVCSVYDDNSNGVKLGGIKGNRCYFEALDYEEEDGYVSIEDVKPYLRPMDSMTDAESEELHNIANNSPVSDGHVNVNFPSGIMPLVIAVDHSMCDAIITWLNAHHFDYRRLIYNGLAFEAPENMYNHCNQP